MIKSTKSHRKIKPKNRKERLAARAGRLAANKAYAKQVRELTALGILPMSPTAYMAALDRLGIRPEGVKVTLPLNADWSLITPQWLNTYASQNDSLPVLPIVSARSAPAKPRRKASKSPRAPPKRLVKRERRRAD